MPAVQIYQYFTTMIDGRSVVGGSLSEARSITLGDGEVYDQTFKIAASGIVKIFDVSENEALGDADFIWLEADRDVLIQFTAGAGGASEAYDVKELAGSGTAGQMGPAIVLGSDLGHKSDGSVDLFDGTEDVIGEVWAKNEDSTETARVRIVVAT